MSKKKSRFRLKIRTTKGKEFASVWLIAVVGSAEECVLYGDVPPRIAEDFARQAGIEVEYEEWLFEQVAPQPAPGCADIPTQQLLFEDVA